MLVPWPPSNETEPPSKPTKASSPKDVATAMPVRFCRSMNPIVTATRIKRGIPPAQRVLMSEFKPIEAKK